MPIVTIALLNHFLYIFTHVVMTASTGSFESVFEMMRVYAHNRVHVTGEPRKPCLDVWTWIHCVVF